MERGAALELFASEVALARARADSARHARRQRSLAIVHARLVARAAVVRGSLAATQTRIGLLLRQLYVEGDAEPVEVLLGARSLDAVMEGVDGLERAVRRNRWLIVRAHRQAKALRLRLAEVRRAQAQIRRTQRLTALATARLEAATVARRATVLTLRRRATAAQVAAQTEAAKRAAVRVQSPVTLASSRTPVEPSAPTATAAPVASGATRTLVVDAVAYHLPGRTSSGLPGAVGVVAVDPNVIPLGTRLFVPGYGRAVAADTGAAIRGAIIDLWMPSTAASRAWGRRTVTITVYG
jgi:3D (Asp-Asp-Asp) domain-containing protein